MKFLWANIARAIAMAAKPSKRPVRPIETPPAAPMVSKMPETAQADGISPITDDLTPVVDSESDTKPVLSHNQPNMRDKPMANQSQMRTLLILKRGLLQTSAGQIGEITTEAGDHVCYVCEDVTRLPALLDDHSNFDEIAWMCNPDNPDAVKVYGKTAVSAGLYQVSTQHDRQRAINEHARYFRDGNWHKYGIMELLKVPGFTYIQMHPGNWPKDTLGCPLIGDWDGKTVMVARSRINYRPFYERYAPVADAGQLWIRIIDADK